MTSRALALNVIPLIPTRSYHSLFATNTRQPSDCKQAPQVADPEPHDHQQTRSEPDADSRLPGTADHFRPNPQPYGPAAPDRRSEDPAPETPEVMEGRGYQVSQ